MYKFSKEAYFEFYEHAQEAILILQNNRLIDCNQASLDMFKYKHKKNLLLSHPSHISPPMQSDNTSSFEKAEKMFSLALDEGKTRFDWQFKKKTEEVFWVEIVLTALKLDGQQYIYASCRNIQEKKNLEAQQLVRENQAFQYILENEQYKYAIDNYMIVSKTNNEGLITFVNTAFCEISGYSRQELIGTPHSIIRHPEVPKKFFSILWEQISSGLTWHGTIRNKAKNGDDYYVKTIIIPIRDETGSIYEYISIREDITPLIRERDLALAYKKDKELLLSKVSHELRTPLNGIHGFSDILFKTSSSIDTKTYAELISKESTALLELINELLDGAKLNSDHFELSPTPANLFLFIAYEMKFFLPMMSEKNIDFIIDISPSLPEWISLDIQRLKQVIHNLLNNALKFTPVDGTISLGAKMVGSSIKFSVEDNGIGIEEEMQEKIFEAFTQASGFNKQSGTGLGLSIASSIVKKMNSQLLLESKINEGSTFSFFLKPEPIHGNESITERLMQVKLHTQYLKNDFYHFKDFCHQHLKSNIKNKNTFIKKHIFLLNTADDINDIAFIPANSSFILSEPGNPSPEDPAFNNIIATGINNISLLYASLFEHDSLIFVNNNPLKELNLNILVAEDYETNQLLIKNILESLGAKVTLADDGKEAMQLYKKHSYDLILADIHMPKLDGMQMAKLLSLENSTTPIYALTADISMKTTQHFTGVLYKPLDVKKVVSILEDLNTAKQEQVKPTPLCFDTLMQKLSLPEAVLFKLLTAYSENSIQSMQSLKEALKNRELQQIKEITHKLKGSAGTLQQHDTYELFLSIEDSLAKENLSKVSSYVLEIDKHLQELQSQLACKI